MKALIKTIMFLLAAEAAMAQALTSEDLGEGYFAHVAEGEFGFSAVIGPSAQPPEDIAGWLAGSERDPITDRVRTEVFRPADTDGVYLYLTLHSPGDEQLCVGGHRHPSRVAVFRIDSNEPVEVGATGCMPLTQELEDSLRQGDRIVVRGYRPSRGQMTMIVDLDGFAQMIGFVRERRLPAAPE